MTKLPEVAPGSRGHGDQHALLKEEYDKRHPDTPLPALDQGVAHWRIHELLELDLLEWEGLPALIPNPLEPWTTGHIAHHNFLHRAYSERNNHG